MKGKVKQKKQAQILKYDYSIDGKNIQNKKNKFLIPEKIFVIILTLSVSFVYFSLSVGYALTPTLIL